MSARAPYELFVDRELFVVRWRDPTDAGARGLAVEVERQHRVVGIPLVFVFVIGPDCPPPSKQTAELMLRHHERIYDITQTVRALVLGGSLRQTVMRSVLTAMTLAAGLRGQPFAVDKTTADLARVVQQMLGRDADQLVQAMIANGIVTAAEAGTA
ncbi:hypothetical protein [Enhygromyxa salina]|uniref:Uncharacterized protein n=1 Tax=Enhygromyxa salina TaxID=215803 RepID=A0A2S9YPU5_9BACT|nr:hypothetical protein [Enhygromyxa salina]PRQ07079.1 hypothetical protein ENSA7_32180 [Enhygromyxa salina]